MLKRCYFWQSWALFSMASLLSKRDSAMQISDELFRGRKVIAADGQAIGEVAVLFFETSTWTIVSVQVKFE